LLTGVTIPGSVTNIGYAAFDGSGLTSVIIPGSVTNMGSEAFGSCTSLACVTIPATFTAIPDNAFAGCSALTKFSIPGSVTSIGEGAFSYAGLTSITIPCSVTNIGGWAFYQSTGLTSVFFTGNAPAVGSDLFDLDYSVIAYYLPGTTGWDIFAAETGISSVLWNPLTQTSDASFGVQNGQFGFTITNGGGNNIPIMVQTCTDLGNPVWIPLQSVTLTNSFYFSDPQGTNYTMRFYRISSP
jgi:hypothetical protein